MNSLSEYDPPCFFVAHLSQRLTARRHRPSVRPSVNNFLTTSKKILAARGRAYFPYVSIYKTLKISWQKPLDRFQYNFAETFLWGSSTKIVLAIPIRQKTWPPGAGLIFLYIYIDKSSCQKPPDRFQYNFAKMLSWWPSTKIVQAFMIRQKIMAASGRRKL